MRIDEIAPARHVAAEPRPRTVSFAWITMVAVAASVFEIGYNGGSYDAFPRGALAIVVWWTIVIGLGIGFLPRARETRSALVIGGALATLAGLDLLSAAWAPSGARAFAEFNRTMLYLGVFVLVVTLARRADVGRWCDGLAAGLTAIIGLGLVSRLFLGAIDIAPNLPPQLRSFTEVRLSYPVGYWNGLGILTAMTLPLLLRIAVQARRDVVAALAVAAVPALAAALYLTASRGGFLCAALAAVVFTAMCGRAWRALGVAAAVAPGALAVLLVLASDTTLANGPLDSGTARSQGHVAALVVLLAALFSAASYLVGRRTLGRRFRAPRRGLQVVAAGAVALAIIAVLLSHPVARARAFASAPSLTGPANGDYVQSHLLSANGSGRWQFWHSAVREWRSAPVAGRGAGTYESWWSQHGTLDMFIRDAHSLYVEALGELGLVGLAILLTMVGAGLAIGVTRSRAWAPDTTPAALFASFAAYAVGAGIDWMWELTVVTVVAVATLGLLTVAGAPNVVAVADRRRRGSGTSDRLLAGIALIVVGWVAVCSEAIPLLTDRRVADSQDAVGRGDAGGALKAAQDARALEPWSPDPYRQTALVDEQLGAYAAAHRAVDQAISRDPEDWRLWLIAARLETKSGDIARAKRRLAEVRRLNPRSPLFRSGQ